MEETKLISSEPSGLSFRHYKAGIQSSNIAEFDAIMRNIPHSFGFAPKLWKQMTDVEILKKAGVFNVAKMRMILLINADLNMNNKQLGRNMIQHAKHLKVLPRKQYGSRKHLRAIIAALNKHLTMDLR
jgi:hypothetical protein